MHANSLFKVKGLSSKKGDASIEPTYSTISLFPFFYFSFFLSFFFGDGRDGRWVGKKNPTTIKKKVSHPLNVLFYFIYSVLIIFGIILCFNKILHFLKGGNSYNLHLHTSRLPDPSSSCNSSYWTFICFLDACKTVHLNQQPRMPLSWHSNSIFSLTLNSGVNQG